MKTNFALSLSFDGISLLARDYPGWTRVGEVALDTPDLSAALTDLRNTALKRAPDGIQSKLVIPNDQIRFLVFEAEGLDADEIGNAVLRALEGATPYALDELAYDWSISAGQVHIAAVAHDTLSEAEDFAVQHGFNPLCFVAAPEARDFLGEPWFGQTRFAAGVLPDGTQVERDTAAIKVTDTASVTASSSHDGTSADPPPTGDALPETSASDPDGPRDGAADLSFASIRASRNTSAPPSAPAPKAAHEKDDTKPQEDAPLSTNSEAPAWRAPVRAVNAEQDPDPASAALSTDTPSPVAEVPPDAVPKDSEDALPFVTQRKVSHQTPPHPAAALTADRDARRNEKQRMTVFGARDAERGHGKPRYLGISLMAVLLLMLVGVATWASLFLQDGSSQNDVQTQGDLSDPVGFTSSDPGPVPDNATVVAPENETPPLETDADTARVAALPDSDVESADTAGATVATAPPTEDEARARYAVTGIWQRAPEVPVVPDSPALDGLYQASIDPDVLTQDAIALPDVQSFTRDSRPDTPAQPAPPGTRFDFDARGFVRATPEGALSPDGVPVFAGRPALLPPERPEETIDTQETTPGDETVAALSEQDIARLTQIRPRTRPNDLTEQNERAALGTGGRTRAELAEIRPNPRPQSQQELAEEAAASAADQNDGEDGPESDPFAGATAQAVVSSYKPRSRPQGFDRVVAQVRREADQRAQQEAAAQRQTAQQSAGQSPAATAQPSVATAQPVVEPEETGRIAAAVPRNQRVSSNAPTVSSVARAATDKNVLKLRRINLIGVYGGPSDRRALVRLANGRYKKVKVGDRLDGGRVTAIGASELRYSKSGRNVALKMPQG